MILDFLSGAAAQLKRYYGALSNAWTWTSSAEIVSVPTEFLPVAEFLAQPGLIAFTAGPTAVMVAQQTGGRLIQFQVALPVAEMVAEPGAIEFTAGGG